MTDIAFILDVVFRGTAPPAALYYGLVKGTGFTGFNRSSDSMSSHPGWTEYTDYSEATRQRWIPGLVIGDYPAQVSDPTPAIITPTTTEGLIGIFLCDNSTKGGSTGQLFGPWYFTGSSKTTSAGLPFKVGPLTVTNKLNTN